ncbi:pyridoxamine 5'-phosphate oxidase family protein [Mycobacterium sp.]|uniref:pyridoxamine 5'-phosphate oxidase family protein n=1 Tax=Mycobacterium sp. TaxID=1785 RepID=UPI003BAE941B
MTDKEVDAFLDEQRTCRAATVGAHGPHATPLWFIWQDGAIWLTSLTQSQRWKDLAQDPRIAVVIDDGVSLTELRGVELRGKVRVIGEVPRAGEPCPELDGVEQAFADKYTGGHVVHDGKHGWMRISPERVISWDFRKDLELAALVKRPGHGDQPPPMTR